MGYAIGQRVICKVRGASVISKHDGNYDVELEFKILAFDKNKYIVHIPECYFIKNSFFVKEEHAEKYRLNPSYLDTKIYILESEKIIRVVQTISDGGMKCFRCKDYFQMVESNQPDGTFKCYSCRTNPWR